VFKIDTDTIYKTGKRQGVRHIKRADNNELVKESILNPRNEKQKSSG